MSCLELRFVNFLLNEYCIVLYCIMPLRFLRVIAPYATAVGYKRKLLVTEKPRDVCADMSPWNVVDSWA